MNIKATNSKRLSISIVIIIMGILMIAVLPFIVPGMIEEMEDSQKIRNDEIYADFEPQEAQLVTTMRTIGWTYPLLSVLSMLSGFIILFIVKSYYYEQKWARALLLVCFFIPSVVGAYLVTTYYHFLGFEAGFSSGFYFSIVGFIGYFTVLIYDLKGFKQKSLYIWIYFILGLSVAELLANGITCHVIIDSNPAKPIYTYEVYMIYFTRVVNFIGILFITLSVYFISLGKKIGWYFAVVTSASIGFVGYIMQFVRVDTIDFFLQGLMGSIFAVNLLLPAVRKTLIKQGDSEYEKRI
ncbi:MAG: hypothetical protein AB7V16_11805 [Vulcanibacillus sp.]